MATLYVTEQGAQLAKEYQRLIVTKDDTVIVAVPLGRVEHVVLVGHINVTTPALHALLDAGIGLSLLTQWGALRGRLAPPTGKNLDLRRRQHVKCQDPDFCLAIARSIVAGKLRNSRAMARRMVRERPDTAIGAIDRISAALKRTIEAPDLATLRGLEGDAANAYFAILRQTLAPHLAFGPRSRRPPRDPVNALLSLGYTLLTQDLFTACEIVGLDPYDGFYHADKYGRPALALDLVEEFRCVIVDSVVLNLVNRHRLDADDFEPGPDEGIYLRRSAQKRYFQAYAARMNTEIEYAPAGRRLSYQKVFEVQVRRLRHVIEGSVDTYAPFLTR